MKRTKVFCINGEQPKRQSPASSNPITMTPKRKLLLAWTLVGVLPFLLQIRSFLKFVTPHKASQRLVVPPDTEKEFVNLTESCPVHAMVLTDAWWSIEPTHYFTREYGRVCHYVLPQYNVHGHYFVGSSRTEAYSSTPATCAEDSYPYEQYFYHGSIGYYSFYIELVGTFCATDNTSYIVGRGLGTFDMNGPILAADTGSDGYRQSYWYGTVGMIWIVYRALVLRRSFVSCERFGRRCEQMGEMLNRKEAVIFVQENLRLSAHGASNLQRIVLLYLLIEGLMSDMFLTISNSGLTTKLQYASMGYNLSGLMLLVFEMIETLTCLREKWRLFFKRLLFSYETAFIGEVLSSALQNYFLTGLNHSGLRKTKPVALAVSYYAASLVGHSAFVLSVTGFVVAVRIVWALGYAWWAHRTWVIFTASCCTDTTLGLRNKMASLGGYRWENGELFYKASALKALGLMKMEEEDGAEYLAIHKLHWFTVPRGNLVVFGVISGHRVESCSERRCTGMISFLDRRLGGSTRDAANPARLIRVRKVSANSGMADPP